MDAVRNDLEANFQRKLHTTVQDFVAVLSAIDTPVEETSQIVFAQLCGYVVSMMKLSGVPYYNMMNAFDTMYKTIPVDEEIFSKTLTEEERKKAVQLFGEKEANRRWPE
jgi:hypothetical protein